MNPATSNRRPPAAGMGRKKGVPNNITRDMREVIRDIVEGNAPRVQGWLDRVEKRHPAKALAIWERLAEFVLPKLIRSEHRIDLAGFSGEPRVVSDRAEANEAYFAMARGELSPEAVRFETPALAPPAAAPADGGS
jgi:hypothetical protein